MAAKPKHAKLSPSASSRWVACPGSIALVDEAIQTQKIPKYGKSSPAADEGTAAHNLADKCMRNDMSAGELRKASHSDEMVRHVQGYIDYLNEQPGTLTVEMPLDMSEVVPDCYGTSDAVILHKGRLTVIDLKYGRGHLVPAKGNTQLLLYAIGAYLGQTPANRKKIKDVKVMIWQPRMDNYSEWILPIAEFQDWMDKLRDAALATQQANAVRVAGQEQCRWCPASAICETQRTHMEQIIGVDFDDLDLESVNLMDHKRLDEVLSSKQHIVAWLAGIEQYMYDRMELGDRFDSYKLVVGRTNRQWISSDEVASVLEKSLGDAAYVKKLLSPAQVEKELGKKEFERLSDMVISPPGKAVIASRSDVRRELLRGSKMFD